MDKCFAAKLLPKRSDSITANLKLIGAQAVGYKLSDAPGIHLYGSEAKHVMTLPGANTSLGGGLTEAMVRFAARYEYARTVEDVLARRSRLLFLDADLAKSMAKEVSELLREETGFDPALDAFVELCNQYLYCSDKSI